MKDVGGYFYPNQLDKNKDWSDGITRRDWLAGLAMQGLLANSACEFNPKDLADFAYKNADAMIAEGLAK